MRMMMTLISESPMRTTTGKCGVVLKVSAGRRGRTEERRSRR
jgi:hypothetical protein